MSRVSIRTWVLLICVLFVAFALASIYLEHLFFSYVAKGDVPAVSKMATILPFLTRREFRDGSTALDLAVDMNDAELVQVLVDRGSDVNHMSPRLGSPLQAACYFGRTKIALILLKAGAEVNLRGNRFKHYPGTPLHMAAGGGRLETVRLMIEHGADLNALEDYYLRTPLHEAVSLYPTSKDRAEIAAFLLRTCLQMYFWRAKRRDMRLIMAM